MLSRYKGRTVCPDCRGTRLRKDAAYVKINNHSIIDLVLMSIRDIYAFFKNLTLSDYEKKIAHHILREINLRLQFLCNTGLQYLTLNRLSNTLSGGETQRINLARALGSNLTGSMYILDEPSIGLHPTDTEKLISVMKSLRDLGNSVIVVEHDEDIIRESDYIIDLGPGAGRNGGKVVFQGTLNELMKNESSLTAKYFRGEDSLTVKKKNKNPKFFIELKNVTQNNLKNIDVKIPVNAITAVTGVSGSGKSSLVRQVLYPALQRHFGNFSEQSGSFAQLRRHSFTAVEMLTKIPLGVRPFKPALFESIRRDTICMLHYHWQTKKL